jgi:hypothetical protein
MAMTLGTILLILVVILLLGGFSSRFGGNGYGMENVGNGQSAPGRLFFASADKHTRENYPI